MDVLSIFDSYLIRLTCGLCMLSRAIDVIQHEFLEDFISYQRRVLTRSGTERSINLHSR